MPIGQDKEVIHRICPFRAVAAAGHQEIGRATSPREMCTQSCALYDEKEQACSLRVMAMKLAQPLSVIVQGVDTGAMEKRLL